MDTDALIIENPYDIITEMWYFSHTFAQTIRIKISGSFHYIFVFACYGNITI